MRPIRLAAAATLLLASTASGQITFGTPGVVGNCIPFSCSISFDAITGYQQVFSASAFAGPVAIRGIRFYSTLSGGVNGSATYDFSWSTTSVAVGGLSPVLASNITGTDTPFGQLVLAGGLTADIAVTGTPYVYDPADGNLLLTVAVTGWTPGTGGSYWAEDAPGCSRAVNSVFVGAPNNFADARCLVTTLDVTAVPEPSTWMLAATGLFPLGAMAARRRRRSPGAADPPG